MIVGVASASLLAALHGDCFASDQSWTDAAMAQLLRMPGCFGWVESDVEGVPVGLALVRTVADESELLTLGVLPRHRGGGHGARILRRVCAVAAERGAARMLLEVAGHNAAALALYRGAGFEQVGRRPRYYPDGADALLLASVLRGADP